MEQLPDLAFIGLLAASFVGSFMTVALGIGGGAFLLAIMASFMPPAALIPVHGMIQLGSNATRAALLFRHIHRPPFLAFLTGTIVGVLIGGRVVVDLPPALIQIGVGLFVGWSILFKPPKWLNTSPVTVGAFSSFLTMFFGATGAFVANYVKTLNLGRQSHAATHGTFMTLQHLCKVGAFFVLGFSFSPWLPFIAAMISAGFIGTLVGRLVLVRMTDSIFKRALDIVLLLISARLIFVGLGQLMQTR